LKSIGETKLLVNRLVLKQSNMLDGDNHRSHTSTNE
jgi:hypothetical protein